MPAAEGEMLRRYEVTFVAYGDSVTQTETITEEYEAASSREAEELVREDYPNSVARIVKIERSA